jgi:methionine-rich copper-binding protein CopC
MPMRLLSGGGLTAALLLSLISSDPAAAHTELRNADPADSAVLHSPPTRLALTFTAPMQVTALRLLDETGKEHPLIREGARTAPVSELRAAIVQPLPLGAYRVEYRGLSPDGHVGSGALHFRVDASAR